MQAIGFYNNNSNHDKKNENFYLFICNQRSNDLF